MYYCYVHVLTDVLLLLLFHFNTKLTPFSDKKLSKLPHFVIYFCCICVEKKLKIWMPVKLKIFVGMTLNFCMVVFFQVMNQFISNQCCISIKITLRISLKNDIKNT